jgi:hypothetical protein
LNSYQCNHDYGKQSDDINKQEASDEYAEFHQSSSGGCSCSCGVDDLDKLFLEAQGYPVKENVLFQDNQSAMLLEEKGCQSAGKRSMHRTFGYSL